MNVSKVVTMITMGIPIVGILIGGITFGLNFKTDVENIKEDVAKQDSINMEVTERFNTIPAAYDDALIWNAINNIDIPDVYDDAVLRTKSQNLALQVTELRTELDNFNVQIPDAYDDSYLDERVQTLALQVTELRTELNSLNTQDMEGFDDSQVRSRLAELEGQLNALASMDMTSADGSVDISPLIVRIANAEGTLSTLQSSINSVKTDIRTIKSDVTSVERTANSAKSTADLAKSSSSSSRTVENNYDDSNLRNRISTLERQVNALPTESGGATVQRVENPFDASSIRADIVTLQTAVAVLQSTPDTSYNDSSLRNMIDNIQWELDNLNIPTDTGTTDVSWLEEMIWDVKNELSMRIDELEGAVNSTTVNGIYAEKWIVDNLQYEVMYVQEQLTDLQNVVAGYDASTSSGTTTTSSDSTTTTTTSTSGRSWEGPYDEPYWLYVDHQENSYTGDYWMDGYWDGEPVWINWQCGTPGSQFEYCYLFKYNHASWVIQPLAPSNEWLANAYTDGEWPWSGTWNGDVSYVEVKGE